MTTSAFAYSCWNNDNLSDSLIVSLMAWQLQVFIQDHYSASSTALSAMQLWLHRRIVVSAAGPSMHTMRSRSHTLQTVMCASNKIRETISTSLLQRLMLLHAHTSESEKGSRREREHSWHSRRALLTYYYFVAVYYFCVQVRAIHTHVSHKSAEAESHFLLFQL